MGISLVNLRGVCFCMVHAVWVSVRDSLCGTYVMCTGCIWGISFIKLRGLQCVYVSVLIWSSKLFGFHRGGCSPWYWDFPESVWRNGNIDSWNLNRDLELLNIFLFCNHTFGGDERKIPESFDSKYLVWFFLRRTTCWNISCPTNFSCFLCHLLILFWNFLKYSSDLQCTMSNPRSFVFRIFPATPSRCLWTISQSSRRLLLPDAPRRETCRIATCPGLSNSR
jgi:hypothetical protein